MKHTDMELQAIREKLQMLQAEPPAAETLTIPWSAAKAETSTEVNASESPQVIAIETLKQRSRGGDQADKARMDYLVLQELSRIEAQASHINERSQQQARDIMALKRSAQAAAVGLRRQGIHDHPQLAAITQFLDRYESASVPHIERNEQGLFDLFYNTIDFHQAEHEAIDTANALRSRRRIYQTLPFTQPIKSSTADLSLAEPSVSDHSDKEASKDKQSRHTGNKLGRSIPTSSAWIKATFEGVMSTVNSRSFNPIGKMTKSRRHRRRRPVPIPPGEAFSADSSVGHYPGNAYSSQFTWLDGTIWFSGAAIARIIVQSLLSGFPMVETALLVGLISVIAFALYRVVIEKSPNYTLVYRLCIGMMGLFLGGLF